MTFSDILQDCEFTLFGDNGFTQITGNTNRLQAFTALINRASDKVANLILECDGRWQYDDTNYTDLPIATTGLVNNQQDYALSVSHLKVLRVEIKNQDGVYVRLEPFDQNEIEDQSLTEYLNTPATPMYYDIQGGSVLLYPKPQTNYITTSAGLKVYFQREPSYFVTTDTIKTPGFASTFHRLVARWACYDYALNRQLPIAKDLRGEISILEEQLQEFYTQRQPDDSIQFRIKQTSWN